MVLTVSAGVPQGVDSKPNGSQHTDNNDSSTKGARSTVVQAEAALDFALVMLLLWPTGLWRDEIRCRSIRLEPGSVRSLLGDLAV